MKATWAWIKFPSEPAFRAAAQTFGLAPDFLGDGRSPIADQPVRCLSLWHAEHFVACAPCFTQSAEIGLWVAPALRRNGVGLQVFGRAVAYLGNTHPTLYASIGRGTLARDAMGKILEQSGFTPWAENTERTLWARSTGQRDA